MKPLIIVRQPPKSAKSEMFIDGSSVVRFGHLVNAVPGSVAGLVKAHKEHGKLTLAEVMKPSIRLARMEYLLQRLKLCP